MDPRRHDTMNADVEMKIAIGRFPAKTTISRR
jgi:hypothetical protein